MFLYKEADLLLESGVGSEQLLPEGPLRRKVHLIGGAFRCLRTPVVCVDMPLQHTQRPVTILTCIPTR